MATVGVIGGIILSGGINFSLVVATGGGAGIGASLARIWSPSTG